MRKKNYKNIGTEKKESMYITSWLMGHLMSTSKSQEKEEN